MKNPSKNLIFTLTVILLMMVLGCQKEDVENSILKSAPSISYKVVTLDELPQLKPVLENIKKFRNDNAALARGETYLGIDSVLVDNVIQITVDGVSTYSFGIDTDFYNTKYIENLHLHEKGSDYIGYVMRYTTPTGWEADSTNYTPEGYLFLDRSDFDGHVTKYALDGQIIWTSDPNLLGRGNWDTQCSWVAVKQCSNDGEGGQGTLHDAGSGCTGYPKGVYTYRYDYVCETVDYFDSNDSDGTVTGGGGGAPECVYISGSTISGTTVYPGYDNSCNDNPNTTAPILLFEEWQEIVDCINGFDLVGSTDETTLAPIMINWLDTEASDEDITAIIGYLNQNMCNEEAQSLIVTMIEALVYGEVETLEEAYSFFYFDFLIDEIADGSIVTEINDFISLNNNSLESIQAAISYMEGLLSEEVIDISDIETPPSCESFNFSNTSSSWQQAAVKNIRFRVVVLSPQGNYINFDIWYNKPILFGMPRNMVFGGNISNGLAAELSAQALKTSMDETVAQYGNQPATELQVRLYFEQRLKYNYPIITNGGRVNINPFIMPIVPTEYETNFFGTGNCD